MINNIFLKSLTFQTRQKKLNRGSNIFMCQFVIITASTEKKKEKKSTNYNIKLKYIVNLNV